MLSTISWADYTISTCIGLLVWYSFVVLKYYSFELRSLISGQRSHRETMIMERNPSNEDLDASPGPEYTDDEHLKRVEELVAKVKRRFQDESFKKLTTEENEKQISQILQGYPDVRDSVFRSWISEFIVTEYEQITGLLWSEDQADRLWQ